MKYKKDINGQDVLGLKLDGGYLLFNRERAKSFNESQAHRKRILNIRLNRVVQDSLNVGNSEVPINEYFKPIDYINIEIRLLNAVLKNNATAFKSALRDLKQYGITGFSFEYLFNLAKENLIKIEQNTFNKKYNAVVRKCCLDKITLNVPVGLFSGAKRIKGYLKKDGVGI